MNNPPLTLRFRQVHLDFHTSPDIAGIGSRFDKGRWQETLMRAAVDSITLFSKCHHGWSYHPTEVGKMHPHLEFDLLRAQYEATKEIGINCPIYLSAGFDNMVTVEHPDWREVNSEGRFPGGAACPLDAGFHLMDFHSPYLGYLCAQIREVVALFPDCDGIFLDIITQQQSCTRWSKEFMQANGLDPLKEEDRLESSRRALESYYEQTTAASTSGRADMPVFHNSGHISRGRHDLLRHFSHLELESLPTGGWGYDHFPMSAKYACNLPFDFLGMTGKFHTTWGEFGGYKHPNALRYECAAMLAFGAKCSVGDQLHPNGELDPSTYEIIGEAYREVAEKEPWCQDVEHVFDLAILSGEGTGDDRIAVSDEGASRIFLESHFLFCVVDRTMDWTRYKALVLPDTVRIDDELKGLLDAYLAGGGKLILSGESGLWKDRCEFAFDIGAEYEGPSPCQPPRGEKHRGHDYVLPADQFRAQFVRGPQIQYVRSQRIRATSGKSLGQVFDPYFDRTWEHFCSHQHAPNQPKPSGYDCGVWHGSILYFSHAVFRNYRGWGAVSDREFVSRAIRSFMGDDLTLLTNLPSAARVSLTKLTAKPDHHVLHLLYAPTVSRGGKISPVEPGLEEGGAVEVIEDIVPLHGIEVSLRLSPPPSQARTVPHEEKVEVKTEGAVTVVTVSEFSCHQMIELSA